MDSILSFAIEPLEQGKNILSIIPVVNGGRLTELIEEYERGRKFEPLGGYAGLVPSNFKFGPLDLYFLAETGMTHLEIGGHYLLGCTCGEVGCWPLTARISVSKETVVWDRFR